MSVEFQDYYQTLGVSRTASPNEISKAFRKLARKLHPDVNKAPDAENAFKKINEAYEVLKDPEKRGRYDELGADWKAGQEFRPPPEWEQMFQQQFSKANGPAGNYRFTGTGFSNFFNMFFGGAGPSSEDQAGDDPFSNFRRSRSGAGRSDAALATVGITAEEAKKGAVKVIRVVDPASAGGSKDYRVRIPAGTADGTVLRLSRSNTQEQEIKFRVAVEADQRFKTEDDDIVYVLRVTPWEAALGAKISVPTLSGNVQLTLPPGTQGGGRLRLRERGKARRDGTKGDMFAKIEIVMPKLLSDEEKKLFQELAKVSSFQPRKEK